MGASQCTSLTKAGATDQLNGCTTQIRIMVSPDCERIRRTRVVRKFKEDVQSHLEWETVADAFVALGGNLESGTLPRDRFLERGRDRLADVSQLEYLYETLAGEDKKQSRDEEKVVKDSISRKRFSYIFTDDAILQDVFTEMTLLGTLAQAYDYIDTDYSGKFEKEEFCRFLKQKLGYRNHSLVVRIFDLMSGNNDDKITRLEFLQCASHRHPPSGCRAAAVPWLPEGEGAPSMSRSPSSSPRRFSLRSSSKSPRGAERSPRGAERSPRGAERGAERSPKSSPRTKAATRRRASAPAALAAALADGFEGAKSPENSVSLGLGSSPIAKNWRNSLGPEQAVASAPPALGSRRSSKGKEAELETVSTAAPSEA